MKKIIGTLSLAVLVMPLMAQEQKDEPKNGSEPSENRESRVDHPQQPPTPEEQQQQRENFSNQRNSRLLDRTLRKIGLNEEQRRKVFMLQADYTKKMEENTRRLNVARFQFSHLLENDGSDEDLEKIICEIADAQAEQLRILAKNRRKMESILGKEKYEVFMREAMNSFNNRDMGSRGGMPPRPDASRGLSEQRGGSPEQRGGSPEWGSRNQRPRGEPAPETEKSSEKKTDEESDKPEMPPVHPAVPGE